MQDHQNIYLVLRQNRWAVSISFVVV